MPKKRPPVRPSLKAELQQEIQSMCPFCGSSEVACFEIHHIDENPSNNERENLLLLCPTCHTKITKGLISQNAVRQIKQGLPQALASIEVASITVDEQACRWRASPENEYAFYDTISPSSPHPLFTITFINHTAATVVLRAIEATAKHLPSGLSGLGPDPQLLQPLARYHLQLRWDEGKSRLRLPAPIEVPAGRAFAIQLSLSQGDSPAENFPLQGRQAVRLVFRFNKELVAAPVICLNCTDENEPLQLYLLT